VTYRLIFEPDLQAATFAGNAEIDLVVHEPTSELVLNAVELEIGEVTLTTSDGRTRTPAVALDPSAERVAFRLDEPVPTGPAVLRCRFTGILNDKLRGFYRSTYTDAEGVVHTIATTQMEATDARRAFPCWDEPDRKAVFEITLVIDRHLAAYSNSPVVEEIEEGDHRRLRFAPTMKMSTYLVAMIVGPLVATEPIEVDGVPVRVVHVPGKEDLTGFALEAASHALRFFSDYFAIHYPAEKLDLVAIPDFAFGAMENLGCVTFRETALLVDAEHAARTELERVAQVVGHEIAHMWFGDLVTMGWWEGIWLNEAFATFMETLCTDHFKPEWELWQGFALDREAAMAVDGLHSTRPIEYPVGSPEEADGMFDVLTYEKGGSVLRMLEQYLGADVFRDGVRRYLREHAYANTVTADLWDALEAQSGEPVRAVASSWILQGGYPQVTLRQGKVVQEPFAYRAPEPGEQSSIGKGWEIPLSARHLSGGPTVRALVGPTPVPLDPVAAAVPTGGEGDGTTTDGRDLTLLNAGGFGVYRVAYTAGELEWLAGKLSELDSLERFTVVADAHAMMLAGRGEVASFLRLARSLGDEVDPSIWTVVVGALGLMDRVVDEADRPALQATVRDVLGGKAAELGWERRPGEAERTRSLRGLLLDTLGTIGADPAVRAEAVRRFDGRMVGEPIDPDLEAAVLHAVADQLRPGDYEAVLGIYRHPADPQEELRYLHTLAAFPDEQLALRTFELARTEVRTQNAPYLVAMLLGNRVGGAAVWEQVKAHWEELLARFPVNSHARMLDGARSLCRQREVAQDVTEFLTAHPLASGQRTIVQMLERLSINVAFGERVRPTMRQDLAGLP
jgi:puromycin-sensitive aminopeptidase